MRHPSLPRCAAPATASTFCRETVKRAVRAAAQAAGIAEWASEVRPDGKIARLEALKAEGRKVLMVGDGLNDAPALAAAHASLSPSTAADVSQTASDAVFQGEPLAPIVEVLSVARASQRMALENFAIAIGYNIVSVPLAMMGYVTPLIAALAMSLSSIAVTGNALRLRKRKLIPRAEANVMTSLAWLIPCALALGALALGAFLWALQSGQFEDLEGAGWRAIQDDEGPEPDEATKRP